VGSSPTDLIAATTAAEKIETRSNRADADVVKLGAAVERLDQVGRTSKRAPRGFFPQRSLHTGSRRVRDTASANGTPSASDEDPGIVDRTGRDKWRMPYPALLWHVFAGKLGA
jgi:hypothetical protein